ncbi:MAG: hypothetical protein QOK20_1103 [Acidimicrobiaceae bacterium]|nr:hypothetical protein [Acidimicrobiaceae bacterium]
MQNHAVRARMFAAAATVLAVPLISLAATTAPASAAPVHTTSSAKSAVRADAVCFIVSNAYQYQGVNPAGGVNLQFTDYAGYTFDASNYFYDGYGRLWFFGRSSQHSVSGWILTEHLSC